MILQRLAGRFLFCLEREMSDTLVKFSYEIPCDVVGALPQEVFSLVGEVTEEC